MDQTLAQKAIKNALDGNWEKAIEINEKILQEDSDNVDALNRLAKAYSKTGKFKKAKETAKRVLELDKFNTIAQKSLKRWKELNEDGDEVEQSNGKIQQFLEEPGKTTIVKLLNHGDTKVIAKLDAGDEVRLSCSNHRVTITTASGKYVGRIPDDTAARIRELIRHGNEYEAYIKSVNSDDVQVFIRETKRANELANIPSFSTEKVDYISFTPPELVRQREPMPILEEENDEQ